ncbi:hypothetical protein [Mesobacillus maritimus]|uniref:hypothetical protein n=1 Tax=Mesobacillus maritimus TaxID=1643336 RepID=UPI00384CC0BF
MKGIFIVEAIVVQDGKIQKTRNLFESYYQQKEMIVDGEDENEENHAPAHSS